MGHTHTHTQQFHSFSLFSSPHHPALTPSRLLLLSSLLHFRKITLNWKRDPGATGTGSMFLFFLSFFLWIIDSRCLVIHRLHMPANSSGEEKLPTSQPCKSHKPTHPDSAHTHTHTSYLKSFHISPHHHQHLPVFAKSHICTQTNTSPPGCEFSPVRLLHPPHKSQQPGMRGGSKRQVSGWKT